MRSWDWKDEFTYYYSLFGGIVSFLLGYFSGRFISIGLFSSLFCLTMCFLQWKIEERTDNKKKKEEKVKRYNPSQRIPNRYR